MTQQHNVTCQVPCHLLAFDPTPSCMTAAVLLLLPHVIAVRPISLSLAGEARSASHTGAADTSAQYGLDNMDTTRKAVRMAICLLDTHPLSPRPQSEAPGQISTQGCCAQTTAADSTDQQCVPTQAEAPSQLEQWPTPKPSEWADIVLVAERACLTLDRALSRKTAHQASPEVVHDLIVQLSELLKCLVIGHLPDLDLDMCKLFHQGLQPVLAAKLAGRTEYRDLAVAMLSRLAVDCNLIPGGRAFAGPEIVSIFCEFVQAKMGAISLRPFH